MRIMTLLGMLLFAVAVSPSESHASVEGLDIVEAPLGLGECYECHTCPFHPDWRTGGGGVSTIHAIRDFGTGCAPDEACSCDPEEEEQEDVDEQVEVAIDLLIQSEGEDLLPWLEKYGHHFSSTLIGRSLQVARSCGQVMTWVAVSPSEAEAIRRLAD